MITPTERQHTANGTASRERLAEWQARAFPALRRHRDLVTIVDDLLPDDPLRDLDETRRAIALLDD